MNTDVTTEPDVTTDDQMLTTTDDQMLITTDDRMLMTTDEPDADDD